MQPWNAEVLVDTELARTLIEQQFPEFRRARVELLGEGWDNTAHLVAERWVFRFPRRAIAVELLQTEGRVLPELSSRLPLAIPRPCWFGAPGDRYPWPFFGYKKLPGVPAVEAELDDAERVALAPSLASFLSSLHAVESGSFALPGDTLRRLDVPFRRAQCQDALRELLAANIVDRSLHDGLAAVLALSPEQPAPCDLVVCHGDLYCRLLVDENAALSGVIDWGDLHLNLRALDLQVAWSFLPPAGRERFRQSYPPVNGATWACRGFVRSRTPRSSPATRVPAANRSCSRNRCGRCAGSMKVERSPLSAVEGGEQRMSSF